jgi:hypothetical protein
LRRRVERARKHAMFRCARLTQVVEWKDSLQLTSHRTLVKSTAFTSHCERDFEKTGEKRTRHILAAPVFLGTVAV